MRLITTALAIQIAVLFAASRSPIWLPLKQAGGAAANAVAANR